MTRADYWFLLFTVALVGYLVAGEPPGSRGALLIITVVAAGRHLWYSWKDR